MVINDSLLNDGLKELAYSIDMQREMKRAVEESLFRIFKSKGYGREIRDLDKQRFKRVMVEYEKALPYGGVFSRERYYVDNGTNEGLLVATVEYGISEDNFGFTTNVYPSDEIPDVD